jgi:hypothetical protein
MWLLLLLMLRFDGVDCGHEGQKRDLSLDVYFSNASAGQFETFTKSLEKSTSGGHIE